MNLQQVTQEVFHAVEEATGRPVVLQPDASLGTLLAKVKMAHGSAPAHFITYNPSVGPDLDYVACCQCGFVLRIFQLPEPERFSVVGSRHGRKEIESLADEHLRQKGLSLGKEVRSVMAEELLNGLIQQLRSMPIGLRVDAWIRRQYPSLSEQQKRVIAQQLNDHAAVLRPEVRQIAPPKVFEASVGMNAAFALFWSRAWNDARHAVPYKSSGHLAAGEALLKLMDEIPDEPGRDKELVNAWGNYLGLTGWYEFVPYE